MWFLAIKALISGVLVTAVAELAKRFPGVAGLIASLPLISVLAMIWLWREKPDAAGMAAFSAATFWYILPSLPMFLLIPAMLGRGHGFAVALITGCLVTMALYALLTWLGPRLGLPV
jgi:hypothetical protein